MPQFVGSISKHPGRVALLWYGGAILVGTLLLLQPFCHASGAAPVTALDAFFTATSATCVTGLVVRSTGHDFSLWGQLVILGLIQLGGIGIMTVTTLVTFHLGGGSSVRNRLILAETLGAGDEPELGWVLLRVIRMTLLFEAAGFVLLVIRFLFEYSFGEAVWQAVFHSVSAFCNAGFSLHDDSLTRYQGDWLVNLVVIALIICGGLGFPVLSDIARAREGTLRERWKGLSLHSKLMLVGTPSLLLLGTILFALFEWHGTLAGMPLPRKVLVAGFQATTFRTAGFNTVDFANLTNATLFVAMLFMMIGAGPCSTGGGFKVSTFLVLVLRGAATSLGYGKINLAGRTIPPTVVNRAVTTALLFSVVAIAALTALLAAEQSMLPHSQAQGVFLEAGFEVISALGTVGLSTGITPELGEAGRIIIIVLMFLGRLGPITVFAALSRVERAQPIEYAYEEPLIG